jgi:hypothetical protein
VFVKKKHTGKHTYAGIPEYITKGRWPSGRCPWMHNFISHKEHSVNFREHPVNVREHSVNFREHSVNVREQSISCTDREEDDERRKMTNARQVFEYLRISTKRGFPTALWTNRRLAHRNILHGGPIEGKHIGNFSMVDQ